MTTTQYGININPFVEVSKPRQAAELKGLDWVRLVFKFDAAIDGDGNHLFNQDLDQAFAYYEALVAAYRAVDVRALFVLNQETLWGSAPWWPVEKNPAGSGDWESYIDDFAEMAARIAARFAGLGVAYEIWNEGDIEGESSVYFPAKRFAQLLRKTVPLMRAADPDAVLVFGGLAAAPQETVAYVTAVRSAMGGDLLLDAIGVHPYGKWPPPYTTAPPIQGGWFGDMASHLKWVSDAFPGTPLWITEIGLSETVPLPEDQWEEATTYMTGIFQLIQDFGARIPVLIWFAWSDEMRNAGLVDLKGQPKQPIYDTYFSLARALEKEPAAEPITLTPTTTHLRIRSGPVESYAVVAGAYPGDRLTALADAAAVRTRVGQAEAWLKVRTADGTVGWTAAWFVRMWPATLTATAAIHVRSGPGQDYDIVTAVQAGAGLAPLEDADETAAKIGQAEQWLKVQTADGQEGWVAAWYVKRLETMV